MQNKNDITFTSLAKIYANFDGEQILSQTTSENAVEKRFFRSAEFRNIKARIASIRQIFMMKTATMIAAALIIALLIPSVLIMKPWEYKAIALDFTLPEQFTITDTIVDRKITSYIIEDEMGDDVVITLYKSDTSFSKEGLTLSYIGDDIVYVKNFSDYKLMMFYRGGLVYTLTCRYDMNTIIFIYKSMDTYG